MHMKEAPGVPHRHLANAIVYILDEKNEQEKTEGGLYVGGNSGCTSSEVLQTFLDTKQQYDKLDGRQGYHFVLSFAKGEIEKDEAYEVTREFCEQYLKDDYDYVFAVHTDKEHMHAHIIFNSVRRTDGYKYRYVKGDWAKYIQPVADQICIEHGISPLQFDEQKTEGLSYAQWNEKNNQKLNWSSIIRADIDRAIQDSDTLIEFYQHMKQLGYRIRNGYSKKRKASYLTFIYTDENGKQHRRRSYNLPEGYSPEQIAVRLKTKKGPHMQDEITELLEQKAALVPAIAIVRNSRTWGRLYQVVSYYKLPNPYAANSRSVRKDILAIDHLLEECFFIKDHNLKSVSDVKKYEAMLSGQISDYQERKKLLSGLLKDIPEDKRQLLLELQEAKRKLTSDISDADFEEYSDLLEEHEGEFPEELLDASEELAALKKALSGKKKDLKTVRGILANEEREDVPVLAASQQKNQIKK